MTKTTFLLFLLVTVGAVFVVVFLISEQDAESTQQTTTLNAPAVVSLRAAGILNSTNSWTLSNQSISQNQNPFSDGAGDNWILTDVAIGVDACMNDISGKAPQCISIFVFSSTGQQFAQVVLNENNQFASIDCLAAVAGSWYNPGA